MNISVTTCIRQGPDGELSPFDGSAYEEALRLSGARVRLLSMAPEKTAGFLENLTRLGAEEAVLLSDERFRGADTLATAYTLSRALKQSLPDLIFFGRKTLVGDTGQVAPMCAEFLQLPFIGNVLHFSVNEAAKAVTAETRNGLKTAPFPAILSFERTQNLRLPGLFSKKKPVRILHAEDIGADESRTGLRGSPTRVLESFEKETGRRRCRFISESELPAVLTAARAQNAEPSESPESRKTLTLQKVCTLTDAPLFLAKTVSDAPTVLPDLSVDALSAYVQSNEPDVLLFPSDPLSKEKAARLAARLGLGLAADCTALSVEETPTLGKYLAMYRPALSGSVIAKLYSLKKPALLTVRTPDEAAGNTVVTAGYGAKDCLDRVKALSAHLSADFGASRRLVDEGLVPYEFQIGLTGRTVTPKIYLAIGVSGAVHHLAGCEKSGTLIAVNPDLNAPIFDYADYGILQTAETFLTNFPEEKYTVL